MYSEAKYRYLCEIEFTERKISGKISREDDLH